MASLDLPRLVSPPLSAAPPRRVLVDLAAQSASGFGVDLVARAFAAELARLTPGIDARLLAGDDAAAAQVWDAAALVAPGALTGLAPLRPVFALLGAEAEHLAGGHWDALETRALRQRLDALRVADRLFVTREELRAPVAAALELPAESVRAVRLEAASRLAPIAGALPPAIARLTTRPFFFHPGGARVRHNLALLLLGFRLLLERRPETAFDLVLAVRPDDARADASDDMAELTRRAERFGLGARVHVLGRLDDAALGALYAACQAVVLPWLHQGLGLTVQETLQLGRPLLVSRGVPLPAGTAPAALAFDARRPEDIAAALEAALDDARRAELAAASRAAGERLARRLPSLAQACLERLDEVSRPRVRASGGGARPALSLVTPSLDQGAFIERTLRSVKDQGLAGLEYVVMDGGSRDGTLDVLRRHADALRFVSRPDGGQAEAINAGLRATNGALVGWLNSDDLLYAGALPAVVRFFQEHPEVDLVYGDADHVDPHDAVLGAYPIEDWNFERLKETCFLCQPAVFLRRRVLERFGLLDPRLRYCMDYEYWLRVGAQVRPARLRRRLAGSRLHPLAKTLRARVAVHAEINSMLRRRLGFVPERWLHNYAWAVVDAAGHDRARLEDYAGRLTRATLWAFLRWRGRVPRTVLVTASGWLREARARRAARG